MRKLLLVSHGDFAKGLRNTLSVFGVDLSNVTAVSAYTESKDPQSALSSYWQSLADEDQLLIFTDILAGSVNQYVMPEMTRPNTYIFTGMNLPMLLQAVCLPEDAGIDAIRSLADAGKSGVVFMNEYHPAVGSDDE